MTPIQTNKTVFFDKEGLPLNGIIFIGQPGQDPRTNAKTVTFRDSGGVEFTASQANGLPVLMGRIVYNGKPIVSLVDGAYSMLIFDSAGAQVDYSRSIEPVDSTGSALDFSNLIRVGQTLADIKLFDVAVGDAVKNIGKVLSSDGLGKLWLARSATGSPGDDVNLIDFTNGLQGAANVLAIGAGGTGGATAAAARTSLSVIENGAGTVTTANLANNSVTAAKIPDTSVGAEKLQTGNEERDWVLARNAGAAAGAVGVESLMKILVAGVSTGGNVSGSNLRFSDTNGSTGGTPGGTWKQTGFATNNNVTTFLRIS